MQIREAIEEDSAALASLINAAFMVERPFIHGDRTSPDEIGRLLARGAFLVAEERTLIRACVYVELRGDRGYFGMLSVSPERQGAGLGRRMVDAAEARFREAGCASVDIKIVNLRLELPPFYRRLGYAERTTEPWPAEHAAVLKQPAHFIVMTKQL